MKIGYVGLGRMVQRILGSHEVVAYDINPESVAEAVQLGAEPAASLKNLASNLRPPCMVWVMVPAWKVVAAIRREFGGHPVKASE
jgi:6-phosphogluconate dehydrogenase